MAQGVRHLQGQGKEERSVVFGTNSPPYIYKRAALGTCDAIMTLRDRPLSN